ncbi:MAG: NAD(P) transhydrogenase subunit alpha [Eubacterium sp.]|nr:NAD(P) transhydrogenase subunit alpha [Eubacterium sp.]
MSHIVLIIIFLVAAVVGYFIINNVPTLLHTPLMSGMNALSGITILGALAVTAVELKKYNSVLSIIIGVIAIVFAVINVAGGFGITARMLKMFKKEGDD